MEKNKIVCLRGTRVRFIFKSEEGRDERVFSLAERKTLQFNFLAHLDKGVSQEIFGRRIERLGCVICYHVNSLV